jgi:O-methyltransferase
VPETLSNDTDVRHLYLDLLKQSLTGALDQDNDTILGGVRTQGMRDWKKKLANQLGKVAGRFDFEVAYKKPYDPQLRAAGRDWPSRAVSMVGLKRMQNIEDCITAIMEDEVPGDLIETGVWRGGSCIFMRGNLKAWGDTTRKVWVADSFEGLPAPNEKDFPADAGQVFHEQKGLSVGEAVVRHNFERYGLLDDQVKFLKGWFKDTLPTAPIEQLALIRLDGDLYESTIQALEALYPKLSPGGFCIVDDWMLVDQAQQACHDYREAHGITEEVVDIDGTGAYWRKSL